MTLLLLLHPSQLFLPTSDFASTCSLKYATHLVDAPTARPQSVRGGTSLGCDALEDRQFELALLWIPAMDAKMASWRSTGTYVDAFPPFGMNIVDDMSIFKVKRPPGSPHVFTARYVGPPLASSMARPVEQPVALPVLRHASLPVAHPAGLIRRPVARPAGLVHPPVAPRLQPRRATTAALLRPDITAMPALAAAPVPCYGGGRCGRPTPLAPCPTVTAATATAATAAPATAAIAAAIAAAAILRAAQLWLRFEFSRLIMRADRFSLTRG
ncbi:unnamed protein product [Closterium sp. NIES-54]